MKQYQISLHLLEALAFCVLNDRFQIITTPSRINLWSPDHLVATTLGSYQHRIRPLGPLLDPPVHNTPNLIFPTLLTTYRSVFVTTHPLIQEIYLSPILFYHKRAYEECNLALPSCPGSSQTINTPVIATFLSFCTIAHADYSTWIIFSPLICLSFFFSKSLV